LCKKIEVRVPHDLGSTQLWAEQAGPPGELSESAPDLVVLRFLGARGRAELATTDPANRLPDLRSITWTFNPPRFGGSGGPLSIENYLRSALDAYDFIAGRYAGVPVWVYGKSIGATCAIHIAGRRRPAALIAKNVIDVQAAVAHRVGSWMPRGLTRWISGQAPTDLDPAASAQSAKSPALFVISRDDRLSSPDTQEAVVQRYGGSAEVLKVNGGHDQPALEPQDESRYASAVQELRARSASDPSTTTGT
jgi:pimeloyl-ACP methyl ester carboxylesterase